MIFKRKKKTEQTDELHHEYGLISNCGYIIRAFLRYRKSTVAFLLLGGIAGASMSYIWTVIAKLVIDMITQQAGTSGHDITPLLWLVAGTTAVEFVMMWLNTLSAKKLRIGFLVTRNSLVQERIAKTMTMQYEQLEDPDMLDRLQKAKRAVEGEWMGIGALMSNMWFDCGAACRGNYRSGDNLHIQRLAGADNRGAVVHSVRVFRLYPRKG